METIVTLRVIVSEEDFRKCVLALPDSVDDLAEQIKEQLELSGNIRLQYQDPEFDHSWMNLTSVDVVKDKDSLKVVLTSIFDSDVDISDILTDDLDKSSTLSEDTMISTCTSASETSLGTSRSERWPDPFLIPNFTYETELRLAKGNMAFKKDGTLMGTAGIKSQILEKSAETMYAYKAYQSNSDFEAVAEALIKKHPCLKEPGSLTGYYGWKQSVKFKMGNYRSKLRKHGCQELEVNTRKREAPSNRIKRPRKAEVNFLPNLANSTEESLEIERVELLEEVKKIDNKTVIKKKMENTFPLRRKEVVIQTPLIQDVLGRWPALFSEEQICAEFQRITTVPLLTKFHAELDKHTTKLLELMKAKGGAIGKRINPIMSTLNEDQQNDIDAKRSVVVTAVIDYLNEDSRSLIKEYKDKTDAIEAAADFTMAIIVISSDHDKTVQIILEGSVILDELKTVHLAIILLFGLIYSLDLSYPKTLKYFFEFLQKVIMQMGDGRSLSPKVQGLKNKLYRQ